MSAGMAKVIAAVLGATEERGNDIRRWPADEAEAYREAGGFFGGHQAARALWMAKLTARVAEELAKAGYGNAQEVLLAAADEMPIETLGGADKASVWLRQRAHSLDPEGRALVKAIHDRKAEG